MNAAVPLRYGSTIAFELAGLKVTGLQRPLRLAPAASEVPLVVAIPGGGYTARYFDVPGYSLLDRAQALGIPAIALNRPGYDGSSALPAKELLASTADFLAAVIERLWQAHTGTASGVVLVGHSIGGALAILVASRPRAWPLLGIATSGFLTQPRNLWEALPPLETIDLPAEAREQLMFGAPGSFDPEAPQASHVANHPAFRQELHEIVHDWPRLLAAAAPALDVPLHHRIADTDPLWAVNAEQLRQFERQFVNSPRIDTAVVRGAGHCIDFHRGGAAFQESQLIFALDCARGGQR